MFEVNVQMSFSAAHRLRGYKGRPRTDMVRGRCENLHGHNWKVQVSVKAEKLNKQGMVMDFADLKYILNDVLKGLDHKFLNNVPYFKKRNPTSENIAKYIYDRVPPYGGRQGPGSRVQGQGARVKSVTVWETDTSSAVYWKE